MAKKILYKTTAYHCPKCGGITDPRKRFCDYCSRDLNIRHEYKNKNKFRLLVNCGDYVFFDEIYRMRQNTEVPQIEASCLEDYSCQIFEGIPRMDFEIEMYLTQRANELLSMLHEGINNIRFEHLGFDKAFEMQSAVVSSAEISHYYQFEASTAKIRFEQYKPAKIYTHAIPNEILSEMRCPNCGAPITSRLGACIYCSGWVEAEW